MNPNNSETVIGTLKSIFSRVRLPMNAEREFQDAVSRLIASEGITHQREYWGTRRDRLDFFLPVSGVALELKVWSSEAALLRQLKRYADLPEVTAVVLISRRPWKLPETLSGKPIAMIALWKASL